MLSFHHSKSNFASRTYKYLQYINISAYGRDIPRWCMCELDIFDNPPLAELLHHSSCARRGHLSSCQTPQVGQRPVPIVTQEESENQWQWRMKHDNPSPSRSDNVQDTWPHMWCQSVISHNKLMNTFNIEAAVSCYIYDAHMESRP